MVSLQIPSMAYPPSSTVSHVQRSVRYIYYYDKENDWLVVDVAFFITPCNNIVINITLFFYI